MKQTEMISTIDFNRRAGVLLHPTSLPGRFNHGDLGHQAYRFIEFLHQNGFKVWQVLPLGTTHDDKSPYQCLSTHAGNPLLISLDWLIDKGWLDIEKVSSDRSSEQFRLDCLKQAVEFFYQNVDEFWPDKLQAFRQQHQYWLDDYALFIACKDYFNNLAWYDWPEDIRHRDKAALKKYRKQFKNKIEQVYFEQFLFYTQWHEIKEYAHQHQIELFGDMPIFVARDSADVWAERENFLMNLDGEMPFVSGVPPDAFSETGQRWGNPLYDWDYLQSTDFDWWKRRFRSQLELFDLLRIDHFRGMQACWQIPADDDTAINGHWVEVPGDELLFSLFHAFEKLPLIAEDLGVITDEVIALKDKFKLPGMKVLQFAFDGNTKNPHLPHMQLINDVVYTGTHDNDTTAGWIQQSENYNKDYFQQYLSLSVDDSHQAVLAMIRSVMSSVSFLAMIPMQDILMLGSDSRMNVPGTIGDNWQWKFSWDQVVPEINEEIKKFIVLYQR